MGTFPPDYTGRLTSGTAILTVSAVRTPNSSSYFISGLRRLRNGKAVQCHVNTVTTRLYCSDSGQPPPELTTNLSSDTR